MTAPSRTAPQYPLRFPPGMREEVKARATAAGRSLNTEIILALQTYYAGVDTGCDGMAEKLAMVTEARETFGQQAAQQLWQHLGLPEAGTDVPVS